MKHFLVLVGSVFAGVCIARFEPVEQAHACQCIGEAYLELKVEGVESHLPEHDEFWSGPDVRAAITPRYLYLFHDGENASVDVEYE